MAKKVSNISTPSKRVNSLTKAKMNRVDQYANAWNNFGSGDTMARTGWLGNPSLKFSPAVIDDQFRRNWIFNALVMAYPSDATRKWITIEAKDAVKVDLLMADMEEMGVKNAVKDALVLSKLYGGGAIVLGLDDRKQQTTPLDMDNIRDINFLNVIDRHDMMIKSTYNDPLKPKYGEAEIYEIGTRRRGNTRPVEIHETRLIVFKGDYLPANMRNRYNAGWGDPVLAKLNQELKRFGTAIQAGGVLFQDFITKVLKIPNLVELIERNPDAVQTRVNEALVALANHGLVVIGDQEDFEKVQTQITGLTELQSLMIDLIAAAGKVPRARLLNQEAGNLSAAQETTRNYYDDIHSYQEGELRAPIKMLIKIFMRKKDSAFGGIEPDDWKYFFNALWQMNDLDRSKTYKNMAIGDKMYHDSGVLLTNEIRTARFQKEGFSINTDIDGTKKIPERPPKNAGKSSTEVETGKGGKEAESNTGEATGTGG